MYIDEIEKYRNEGSTDEWYVSKLLERHMLGLDSDQAYSTLGNIFEHLLNEEDCEIFLIHCRYILKLAHKAKTTEQPTQLASNLNVLKAKVSAFGLESQSELRELYAWYRV